MRTARTLVIVGAAAVAALGCKKDDKATGGDTATTSSSSSSTTGGSKVITVRPPTFKDLKRYTKDLGEGALMARMETTQGTLNCELFEQDAPLTVANFVGLARGLHAFRDVETGRPAMRPYFDGLIFHRVIPGFMVQGGDPKGSGRGGPGYTFATEVSNALRHDKPGIMSMANGGPNTNGSQFFIMDGVRTSLDGKYNVFGLCKETDVIKKIAGVPTRPGGEGSRPVDPPKIVKVEISRVAAATESQ